MSWFELVRRNVEVEDFDLLDFLQSKSPLTPISEEFVVSMKLCDLDVLRNCIINSIYRQGLALKTKTCRKLVEFLEGDFTDLTKRIYLQVLVHYTKMNIAEIYESYSAQCKRSGIPRKEKLSMDGYFDFQIAGFVLQAMARPVTMTEVSQASDKVKYLLQKVLLSKPVLLALQVCLDDCLASDDTSCTSFEWLKNEISKMQIYIVNNFAPLKGLRGACLLDGILLCTGELPLRPKVYEADLITLGAHECAHYLARCKFGNFNFSSPFSSLKQTVKKRTDLFLTEKNLEIGRCMELLLFEGIQPQWSHSLDSAADKFFDLLQTSEMYPIIPKALHEDIGLRIRIPPTSSFGIDVDAYDQFC